MIGAIENMTTKPLKSVRFEWDPKPRSRPYSDKEMFAKFDCFLPLSMWLTDRLDGLLVATEPTTGTLQMKLTQIPKASCYCISGRMKGDDPIACVDVDPLKLLDIPYDNGVFGERSKRINLQAAYKLDGQNAQVKRFLESQEQAFADNGYVYRWTVHEKKLPKRLGSAKIIARAHRR